MKSIKRKMYVYNIFLHYQSGEQHDADSIKYPVIIFHSTALNLGKFFWKGQEKL